jgi:glycine hydroxymethyltransferase
VRPLGLNGVQAADALEAAGIVVNSNPIPFDTLPPREGGGIRFGTPAITSRGMGAEEMTRIGQMFARVLAAPEDEGVRDEVRREVAELCERYPAPGVPRR